MKHAVNFAPDRALEQQLVRERTGPWDHEEGQAALTVCDRARGKAVARYLLTMLGLLRGDAKQITGCTCGPCIRKRRRKKATP